MVLPPQLNAKAAETQEIDLTSISESVSANSEVPNNEDSNVLTSSSVTDLSDTITNDTSISDNTITLGQESIVKDTKKAGSINLICEVNRESLVSFVMTYNKANTYQLTVTNQKTNQSVAVFDYKSSDVIQDSNEITYASNKLRLSPSTYTITLSFISGNDGDIRLTPKCFENPELYELESNNTYMDATFVKSNTEYKGNLYCSGDTDFYKIDLDQPGKVRFNLIGTQNNDYYYEFFTVDKKGNLNSIVICNYLHDYYSQDDHLTDYYILRLPAGSTYVKVSNDPDNNIDCKIPSDEYTLSYEFTPEPQNNYEHEFNNTMETANKVSVNNQIRGNFNSYQCWDNNHETTDTDYFVTDIKKDGNLNVQLDYPENCYLTLTVYKQTKSGAKKIYSKFFENTKVKFNSKKIKVSKGKYYVGIAADSIKYADYAMKIKYSTTLSKVQNLSAEPSYNSAKLKWSRVAAAENYAVYRSTSKSGTYKKVATVKGSKNTYTDMSLKTGQTYYYKVQAQSKFDGKKVYSGDFSSVISCKTTLDKVKKLTGKSVSDNSICLTWSNVNGASGYKIQCSANSKTYTVKDNLTTYTIDGLKKGRTYSFKIRAYRIVGKKKVYGKYSRTVNVKIVK